MTDNDHIMAIADNLGVPKENRFININPTMKDLKTTEKEIRRLSGGLNHTDKKPHVIFVYAGGHGATEYEQQLFLLNTNDKK